MKLLFDQNISHRILSLLSQQFSHSSSIKKEKLINCSDKEIWEYAKRNNFIIVTQDSDFNDLNSLHGFPPKIIWIRTGNLPTKRIASILDEHWPEIQKFETDDNYGCLEILSIRK